MVLSVSLRTFLIESRLQWPAVPLPPYKSTPLVITQKNKNGADCSTAVVVLKALRGRSLANRQRTIFLDEFFPVTSEHHGRLLPTRLFFSVA